MRATITHKRKKLQVQKYETTRAASNEFFALHWKSSSTCGTLENSPNTLQKLTIYKAFFCSFTQSKYIHLCQRNK
jgi:hypothetical protein